MAHLYVKQERKPRHMIPIENENRPVSQICWIYSLNLNCCIRCQIIYVNKPNSSFLATLLLDIIYSLMLFTLQLTHALPRYLPQSLVLHTWH